MILMKNGIINLSEGLEIKPPKLENLRVYYDKKGNPLYAIEHSDEDLPFAGGLPVKPFP